MDFDTAMESIEQLVGIEVAATIWGLDHDPSFVATLSGALKARDNAEQVDVDALGAAEVAVTFTVGDHWGNELVFWPTRFVAAERSPDGPTVEVTTRDRRVVIHPNRPWIG